MLGMTLGGPGTNPTVTGVGEVGVAVGGGVSLDGEGVGDDVGDDVGGDVGAREGELVGAAVGPGVGAGVGGGVWGGVGVRVHCRRTHSLQVDCCNWKKKTNVQKS